MRFTSPDPLAAPFYNLYHYAGNSPARFFDPDGLSILSISSFGPVRGDKGKVEFGDKFSGDTYFAVQWEGYGERAVPTWDGARVMTAQFLSGGTYYSDAELAARAQYWHDQGLGSYYNAGGFVGGATVLAVATLATAGYAGTAMAGGMAAAGTSSGFAMFAGVTTGSMFASATSQWMTTGTVRGDVMAVDTLAGIVTLGAGATAYRVGAAL